MRASSDKQNICRSQHEGGTWQGVGHSGKQSRLLARVQGSGAIRLAGNGQAAGRQADEGRRGEVELREKQERNCLAEDLPGRGWETLGKAPLGHSWQAAAGQGGQPHLISSSVGASSVTSATTTPAGTASTTLPPRRACCAAVNSSTLPPPAAAAAAGAAASDSAESSISASPAAALAAECCCWATLPREAPAEAAASADTDTRLTSPKTEGVNTCSNQASRWIDDGDEPAMQQYIAGSMHCT